MAKIGVVRAWVTAELNKDSKLRITLKPTKKGGKLNVI
jgi:hypothetical protein